MNTNKPTQTYTTVPMHACKRKMQVRTCLLIQRYVTTRSVHTRSSGNIGIFQNENSRVSSDTDYYLYRLYLKRKKNIAIAQLLARRGKSKFRVKLSDVID